MDNSPGDSPFTDSQGLSEMAIVDIFTRLILDTETPLNSSEQLVISLLEQFDHATADFSRQDLSDYLRLLAVDEMITLVGELKAILEQRQGLLLADGSSLNRPLRH